MGNAKPSLFIAGATGFVGRHLLQALPAEGQNVRCLVRSQSKAELCSAYGFDTFNGNITDRERLRGSLEGVKTVIHLVGIIEEHNEQTFERVHLEGTANLIEESLSSSVKHFFYQSALGASLESPFPYYRTKAEAEEIVKRSGIPYTIFRPSLIVGPGDKFSKSIVELLQLGPVVPVPGNGKSRMQPVFISDWVQCMMQVIESGEASGKVYEFGGPEQLSYNDILNVYMRVLGQPKRLMHIPPSLTKAGIPLTGIFSPVAKSVGLKLPSITSDQVDMLQIDNITGIDSLQKLFGFEPLQFEEAVKRTLLS